jgi:hypothetical protein
MAAVSMAHWGALSAFSFHARQANAILDSVDIRSTQNDSTMDTVEATYVFRICMTGEVNDIDDFEVEFLRNRDYDEMKRIVDGNPELKLLYEKYKIMDKLAGK